MSSTPHFPALYQVPVLHSFSASPAPYTLLHFITASCYEAVLTLQQQFQDEELKGELEVLHIYSGGNPYPFGAWVKELGSKCHVAWLGPESGSDLEFMRQKISSFPFFIVLEGQRVIHADSYITFPLSDMPQKYINRNLRKLAISAVSLKPRDASSEIICSVVIRDLIKALPLPEPVDLIAEQQRLIEKLKGEVLQKEREIEELKLAGYF